MDQITPSHNESHDVLRENQSEPLPKPWRARKPDSRVLKLPRKHEQWLMASPVPFLLAGVALVAQKHHTLVIVGCCLLVLVGLIAISAGSLDVYETSRLRNRKRRNLCVECGYSRGRLEEREACPECGAASWAAW